MTYLRLIIWNVYLHPNPNLVLLIYERYISGIRVISHFKANIFAYQYRASNY